jgi:hypothetical protein
VTIGYSLPLSTIERIKLSKLRVYVTGQNIFALKKSWGADKFTGMDPENPGTGYPMPFSFYFGVNVSF